MPKTPEKSVFSENFPVTDNTKALNKAIKVAGSQAELARRLQQISGVKCYPQKVNDWRARGSIPPYWVGPVAQVLGVSKKELDPVLYDEAS